MDYDIVVIGGGPAGLSFAASLAQSPFRIALIEQQCADQLAQPAYDGREIALTQRSMALLKAIGAWDRIAEESIAQIRAAHIFNGSSTLPLIFDNGKSGNGDLGTLVSNHNIRRALFECVSQQANVALHDQSQATAVSTSRGRAEAQLADGRTIAARLLVAADSRFSKTRDQLGIAVEMKRSATAMLVCRVAHEMSHDGVATEWFRQLDTIAMLPLNGRMSSAVLTVSTVEAERLAAMSDDTLSTEIAQRFGHRLGSMSVAGSRHLYPLTMTYARNFAVPGAALIGDAAVGMHPVTAHGYNLGLASTHRLAELIRSEAGRNLDWSSERLLRRYEAGHRRASWPIYAGTNLIAGLYRDQRRSAMIARHAGIRIARRLPLFRRSVNRLVARA